MASGVCLFKRSSGQHLDKTDQHLYKPDELVVAQGGLFPSSIRSYKIYGEHDILDCVSGHEQWR
jgi:hypothetical protein